MSRKSGSWLTGTVVPGSPLDIDTELQADEVVRDKRRAHRCLEEIQRAPPAEPQGRTHHPGVSCSEAAEERHCLRHDERQAEQLAALRAAEPARSAGGRALGGRRAHAPGTEGGTVCNHSLNTPL